MELFDSFPSSFLLLFFLLVRNRLIHRQSTRRSSSSHFGVNSTDSASLASTSNRFISRRSDVLNQFKPNLEPEQHGLVGESRCSQCERRNCEWHYEGLYRSSTLLFSLTLALVYANQLVSAGHISTLTLPPTFLHFDPGFPPRPFPFTSGTKRRDYNV